MSHVIIDEPGPLTTIQDRGRIGHGAIGVGRSGACDRAAYELSNRLVGNASGSAALEVTFGGLALRAEGDVTLAVTGAPCPGTVHNGLVHLRSGDQLRLAPPSSGLRTYVSVRGGIDVEPVMGSRSTDILGGLGPAPLQVGDRLAVGAGVDGFPPVEVAPGAVPDAGLVRVRVVAGPRREWFSDDAWRLFTSQEYAVSSTSNRVGVRLEGEALARVREGEISSEGMLRGALQMPPSGLPVLFLADHPVTGGYPVIGYVDDRDVDRCGQLRPGQTLRFVDSPG